MVSDSQGGGFAACGTALILWKGENPLVSSCSRGKTEETQERGDTVCAVVCSSFEMRNGARNMKCRKKREDIPESEQ